ncbi:MAG: hypothetical protein JRD68_10510 [Deltaproteobacteria bacterium]|nr:hypothetical protein [Deltaproteobacteria bacterium]
MPDSKKDQIKLYIVIALVILAVIIAYFRFFYHKAPKPGTQVPSTYTSGEITVPQVNYKSPPELQKPLKEKRENFRADIRDIFAPSIPPKKAQEKRVAMTALPGKADSPPDPIPVFTLGGTIIGSGKPMAIINERFLRVGEFIEGYKVVSIEAQRVLLVSGKNRIALEMVTTNE